MDLDGWACACLSNSRGAGFNQTGLNQPASRETRARARLRGKGGWFFVVSVRPRRMRDRAASRCVFTPCTHLTSSLPTYPRLGGGRRC